MKKIEKILVPVDFSASSANAFRYAITFADKYAASIELLHVIYPDVEPIDFPVAVSANTERLIKGAKKTFTKFVETGIAQVQANTDLVSVPNIQSDLLIGNAPSIIADKAKRMEADLIIMGTNKSHNALERFFGSVAVGTINQANCPVLVVPGNFNIHQIKRIGYATDLSTSDPFFMWEVGQLFAPFKAIMKVYHAKTEKETSKKFNLKDLEAFFEDRSPALQIKCYEDTADTPETGIDEFVFMHDIDLLIMPKPKRGFFDGLFHRSVTKKVALKNEAPMLFLK